MRDVALFNMTKREWEYLKSAGECYVLKPSIFIHGLYYASIGRSLQGSVIVEYVTKVYPDSIEVLENYVQKTPYKNVEKWWKVTLRRFGKHSYYYLYRLKLLTEGGDFNKRYV